MMTSSVAFLLFGHEEKQSLSVHSRLLMSKIHFRDHDHDLLHC